MKYTSASILMIIMLCLVACENDSNLLENDLATVGLIKNLGPIPADGCGWVVEIDSTNYSPINFSDEQRKDGQYVNLYYKELNENLSCGLGNVQIKKIEILKLSSIDHITFYRDQTQCSDPWGRDSSDLTNLKNLKDYINNNGIETFRMWIITDKDNGATCAACNCRTGSTFFIDTDIKNESKMLALGFVHD